MTQATDESPGDAINRERGKATPLAPCPPGKSSEAQHQALFAWAERRGCRDFRPLQAEASARDFFRVRKGEKSHILMLAPPAANPNNIQTVRLSCYFREIGLRVPEIYEVDLDEGFFLEEDLGQRQYFEAFSAQPETAGELYEQALNALFLLWQNSQTRRSPTPDYTRERFAFELQIFNNWFVGGLLKEETHPSWSDWRELLLENLMEQPRACVHRDFHSRNLIYAESPPHPGIVDYQDALWGPLSYDLISLTEDCYVTWPEAQRQQWRESFRSRLAAAGADYAPALFASWCDHSACQRHLKAVGIFARLWIRDGKPGWLKEIPRTLAYVLTFSKKYLPFQELAAWLEERLLPAFDLLTDDISRAANDS